MDIFIKHNIDSKKHLEEIFCLSFAEILKHVNWIELGFDNNMFHRFVCTNCGGHVSIRILDFFNFDVEKVLCFSCQKKAKMVTGCPEYKEDSPEVQENLKKLAQYDYNQLKKYSHENQ